jgi:hypothetical protein
LKGWVIKLRVLDKFREKSRRMFQNIDQISYYCKFASKKGGEDQ